jgi:hypothetical protein
MSVDLRALDAVFVSFNEPRADELYADALRSFPALKRLHGVRGAGRAYALSAQMVDTQWYVLIDADCRLLHDEFDVGGAAEFVHDADVIVWLSRNEVNDLVCGYGGVKLVRTHTMRCVAWASTGRDVLTRAGRLQFLKQVGCMTLFNQSPFQAWKAAFRETLVLLRDDFGEPEARRRRRIDAWARPKPEAAFSEWVAAGASDAIRAFSDSAPRYADWDVNDGAMLAAEFARRYPHQSASEPALSLAAPGASAPRGRIASAWSR